MRLPVWGPASSEACASPQASEASDCIAKNINVLAVVIAELEFREIQRQVRFADVVICPQDSTLEQRPEVVNIGRVNIASHVFVAAMVHGAVLVSEFRKVSVAGMFIRRHQINLIADGLPDEFGKRCRIRTFNHLTDYVPLAANGSEYGGFGRRAGLVNALTHVAIAILPAEVRFVHFNNTHELAEILILHRRTEPMAEIPSGLIGTRANLPVNLESANALFAIEHRIENLKPSRQRVLCVLHNSPSEQGKPIAGLAAFGTLPVALALQLVYILVGTARTSNAIRPAMLENVGPAGFFGMEGFHQLLQRHHVNSIQEKRGYVKC